MEEEYKFMDFTKEQTIHGDIYEDFPLIGSFIVNGFNLYNGDTITYSRDMDYYQFRIVKRLFD